MSTFPKSPRFPPSKIPKASIAVAPKLEMKSPTTKPPLTLDDLASESDYSMILPRNTDAAHTPVYRNSAVESMHDSYLVFPTTVCGKADY